MGPRVKRAEPNGCTIFLKKNRGEKEYSRAAILFLGKKKGKKNLVQPGPSACAPRVKQAEPHGYTMFENN